MQNSHLIGQNILKINRYIKLGLRNALGAYHLGVVEGMVLFSLLQGNSEMCFKTQEQIINELNYDKGVMSRAINTLQENGYIKQEVNEKDRRSKVLVVTHKADGLKQILENIFREWDKMLLDGFEEEDIRTANCFLNKLEKNAKNLYKKSL
ncbi:MAG: MarR family winged helix-turn-helix transcriptional regulator [Christensenella sp.]|nr:MarR family winged helix-turn-helix transcriptional regulator [Christensenella sp.]